VADGKVRTSTMPGELRGVLPELETFGQQTRGLRFKGLPKVTAIPESNFKMLLLDTGSDSTDTSQADRPPSWAS